MLAIHLNFFIILFYVVTVVSFNQPSYSHIEGAGPVQPILVLSNPSSTEITVEVMNTNVSASGGSECIHMLSYVVLTGGGVDYDSGPYTVTFPAGVTIVSFDVPINDDNILEDNENFNLYIANIATLFISRVFSGDLNQSTVTIMDTDSKSRCGYIQGWI